MKTEGSGMELLEKVKANLILQYDRAWLVIKLFKGINVILHEKLAKR